MERKALWFVRKVGVVRNYGLVENENLEHAVIALDTAAGSVGSSFVAIVGRLDVGASPDWLE
jgi:hypothetical protein